MSEVTEEQATIAKDAADGLCAACREKLNKKLTRLTFLRGYNHVNRIVMDTVCEKCLVMIGKAKKKELRTVRSV